MSNRTVKWGVLGTGFIAKTLIAAIQDADGAELAAIASRQKERAEAAARDAGIPRAYGSYEELLADQDIQAIYVSLPNGLHAEWSIKAAEAGKDVLCEKPLACSVEECRRMLDAAAANRVRLMEAFQFRFHPQTHRARGLVAEGAIGELRLIRSAFSFGMYDLTNVRLSKELCGGVMMDVGCYCINISRALAGAEPEHVLAEAVFGVESGVDETLCGTLRFPGEAIAQFDCSFRTAGRAFVEVVGSTGRMEIPSPWKPGPEGRIHLIREGHTEWVETPGKSSYVLEVEHLSTCIRDGLPVELPPADALANTKVIEALLRSAREGRAVSL